MPIATKNTVTPKFVRKPNYENTTASIAINSVQRFLPPVRLGCAELETVAVEIRKQLSDLNEWATPIDVARLKVSEWDMNHWHMGVGD